MKTSQPTSKAQSNSKKVKPVQSKAVTLPQQDGQDYLITLGIKTVYDRAGQGFVMSYKKPEAETKPT